MNAAYWVALVLVIIGSLNWGLVGLLDFDLVATLFGPASVLSRTVYSLVGFAGIALAGIALTSLRSHRHEPISVMAR